MANTRDPILHPVPILSLRPTQMTVGLREVKEGSPTGEPSETLRTPLESRTNAVLH